MALADEVHARRTLPSPDARRLIRVAARVSLQRMADELGVQPSTVMRWEQGLTVPRPQTLDRYAALLEALKREIAAQ